MLPLFAFEEFVHQEFTPGARRGPSGKPFAAIFLWLGFGLPGGLLGFASLITALRSRGRIKGWWIGGLALLLAASPLIAAQIAGVMGSMGDK